MKRTCLLVALIAFVVSLSSCSNLITRTEEDVMTKVHYDTLRSHELLNNPGNRENGVVYPSSNKTKIVRDVLLEDSTITRVYPDFIRLGVFESVGTLFGSKNSIDNGLFGIFPDPNALFQSKYTNHSSIFSGGIYRVGIVENRLRWFQDAKNWTIGTSLFETIIKSDQNNQMLYAIAPLYVRKRWFVNEKIPYQCFTLSLGLGYLPDQYINASGSYDIGSIGGLNLRAYIGLVTGMSSRALVSESGYKSGNVVFPYFGLGVSFLDFLNIVPETEKEWKYYKHSSWNIGLMQFAFINNTAKNSIYTQNNKKSVFNGFGLKLMNASVSLPLLDNKLYAGTSFVNLMVLAEDEWFMGIMPVRVGYFQTVIADELITEPFLEMNYYPSTVLHVGNRLNLAISKSFNISLILGYVNGSTNVDVGKDLDDAFGRMPHISRFYLGIGINIVDRLFYPSELSSNQ